MAVIHYKDENGVFCPVPTIVGPPGPRGPQGDKGASGVYVLAPGKTIGDAPAWANVVVSPDEEPPALELVATFADGTTQTYNLYGKAVAE